MLLELQFCLAQKNKSVNILLIGESAITLKKIKLLPTQKPDIKLIYEILDILKGNCEKKTWGLIYSSQIRML